MTDLPRRLGVLCHGWPPSVGGVETLAHDLAVEFAARGHELRVLCLDGSAERGEDFSQYRDVRGGVVVDRIAYAYGDHDRLARQVRNERMEHIAAEWVRHESLPLVHVHHATGFGLGIVPAMQGAGAAVLFHLHDHWPLCPRGQLWHAGDTACPGPSPLRCADCVARTWPHLLPSQGAPAFGPTDELVADDETACLHRTSFAVELVRRADHRIACSESLALRYARHGLDGVHPVPNGVRATELAAEVELRRMERPKDHERVVGVLGAVQPSKGVVEFAQAFLDARVAGWRLEVHGPLAAYHGDDSYVELLMRMAENSAALRVLGPYRRQDLPALLAKLDAVAVPSLWEEPSGLSAREAQAVGLTVFACAVGGLLELRAGGGDVHFLPPADPSAWTRILTERLNEPSPEFPPPRVRELSEMADDLEQHYRITLAAAARREEHPR
ncbi:MAG: glycosyltransferase [Planctomycetes bacterium]|nr:glycosyltransferase [Planctomycetota bacterium]MCB9903552.1 glycosyltransferase [Planctomycetota bacterium]